MGASATLVTARQMVDEERFYFPYRLDFRGRMYTLPTTLTPQGSDLSKGLLRFDCGKVLGGRGWMWLRVHCANSFGVDKVSFEDRAKWVDENLKKILSTAENPHDFTWWHEADAPFQFLASCFEIASAVNSGNPETFSSTLPVLLDGSCNGIQHLAALSLDEEAGRQVNLLPSVVPSDIYQSTAEALKVWLKNEGSEVADQWLQYGIKRKLTKRPTMIFSYNGTRKAFRGYTEEYLNEEARAGKVGLWGKDLK
jgi:DNA-directed RNA polymerase